MDARRNHSRHTVLVVDDHVEMANVLAEQLVEAGYTALVASSAAEALEHARGAMPDVVLTDLRMETVDGLDLLAQLRGLDPRVPVLIMTAFGAVDTAVEAIKAGAFHYLTKPLKLKEMLLWVERAISFRALADEAQALRRQVAERSGLGQLVGKSAVMRKLYEQIQRVAHSPVPVLIRGESGSGKELVARALHFEGPRRDRPFVALNCTALPENLLESELYGHTRGAFTGAVSARRGLFAEADGGTLFLDEIGDMAPALQAKLLRTVESGEIRALGADGARRVDVRVVAATHQSLEERVKQGLFRADLFYRLNVVSLAVPSLRERAEDIPLLVERFLTAARSRSPESPVQKLSPKVIARLAGLAWPGNVRELENLVERLVIMAGTPVVDLATLEAFYPALPAEASPLTRAKEHIVSLRQLEDEYIGWVLARCDGNKTQAASLLGIDASTIYRRERGGAVARGD